MPFSFFTTSTVKDDYTFIRNPVISKASNTTGRTLLEDAKLSATGDTVDQDGDDDDHPDDQISKCQRRSGKLQTVVQNAPDERTDDRAEEQTLSAHGANAADDGRRHRVQFVGAA